MKCRWSAALALRLVASLTMYGSVSACGSVTDVNGPADEVGEASAALSLGAAGGGAVADRNAGHCVKRWFWDSVPDGIDEDCDGRIDEDCDHRPFECPRGYHVIEGSGGDDVLIGTSRSDCILGYGGDDQIQGAGGNDLIFGGPGKDRIVVGSGHSVIFGGAGDDDIDVSAGKGALVYAGAGHDVVRGGSGHDTMFGGAGNDHLIGSGSGDALFGEGCNDWLEGGAGPDAVLGGSGFDVCDTRGCDATASMRRACDAGHHCPGSQVCAQGVQFCVPAAYASCNSCTPKASDDSSCDGVDDDCDGKIDENFVSGATRCGVGACQASGALVCGAGGASDSCVPGTPAAADASCDGIDDDCDGKLDEDFVTAATSCGVGACASTGTLLCDHGSERDTCSAGAPSADDNCNGVDEDCNGLADDAFPTVITQCGAGSCASTGGVMCMDGHVVSNACTPTCEDNCIDGADDDGDGAIDCLDSDCHSDPRCGIRLGDGCAQDADCAGLGASPACIRDLPGGFCTASCTRDADCQAGSCISGRCYLLCDAQLACADASLVCSHAGPDGAAICHQGCSAGCPDGEYCEPQAQLCQACLSQDTTCDGVDDDCDGVADDDVPATATSCGGSGLCSSSGILSCVNGHMVDSCVPRDLSDNDPCSDDVCDPATGVVTHSLRAVGSDCSDGDACNGSETCQTLLRLVQPFKHLDPRAPYIRTHGDAAIATTPVALASLGIAPGDRIVITRQGSHSSNQTAMGALFSSSATLLDSDTLNRVPGALMSDAPAVKTGLTFQSAMTTDIPQDFAVSGTGTAVTVPAGATHLFVGVLDSYFGDNTDPDGDFGFRIELSSLGCVVTQPPAPGCQ
jgi:hypothetical protein